MEEKIVEISKAVRFAPDSDDVAGIIRRSIDELIDNDIMGLRLRLFLKDLEKKLESRKSKVKDFIELNNLNRAIDLIKNFEKVFSENSRHYELN